MPDGVDRRRDGLDTDHGAGQIWDNFVPARENYHAARSEGNGPDPVADHVQVDQAAAFGDRVGAGDEKISLQDLTPFLP